MKEVVGIQFKTSSRLYYFAPNGNEKYKVGDYAIVETVRGLEFGTVIVGNRIVEDDQVPYELKTIVKRGTDKDAEHQAENTKKAEKNFAEFKVIVNEMNLEMKPLYAEYTIDGQKLVFYYTAEDRVDFRELLKVLASRFKTRIELRQIGEREAARIIGGLGVCGRVLCCKSCLNNFDYVTMKMAKDQNMSLNTSKISGLCGKLMCCIGYEHEIYLELKKELPNVGELVRTPNCSAAKVVSIDYMKKILTVKESNDSEATARYEAKDISPLHPRNPMVDEGLINVDDSDDASVEDLLEPKKDIPNNGKKQNKYQKVYNVKNIKKGNKKN